MAIADRDPNLALAGYALRSKATFAYIADTKGIDSHVSAWVTVEKASMHRPFRPIKIGLSDMRSTHDAAHRR